MAQQRRARQQLTPEQLLRIKAQMIEKEKEKTKWHWSLTLTIVGILLGGFLTVYYFFPTMISVWILVGGVAFIGLLFTLLQWKKFYSSEFIKVHFRMPLSIFLLYNFLGIGLLFSGTFLSLNYLFASDHEIIEEHNIIGLDRRYVISGTGPTVILLENDAYADLPRLRLVDYVDAIHWREHPVFQVVFNKGLFGIRVIREGRIKMVIPNELQEILNKIQ